MNSAPCAKFTTPSMPKMIDRPSAATTRIAPRATPEKSCIRMSSASIGGSVFLLGGEAEFGAAPQSVFGSRRIRDDLEQIHVALHVRLLFGYEDKHRLNRLMVAFAVALRLLSNVVFEVFQSRDDLVGLGAAGRLHRE